MWCAIVGAIGGTGYSVIAGKKVLDIPYGYKDDKGRPKLHLGIIGDIFIGAIGGTACGFLFWQSKDFGHTFYSALTTGLGGSAIKGVFDNKDALNAEKKGLLDALQVYNFNPVDTGMAHRATDSQEVTK